MRIEKLKHGDSLDKIIDAVNICIENINTIEQDRITELKNAIQYRMCMEDITSHAKRVMIEREIETKLHEDKELIRKL